jgi:hypothetical protein
MSKRCLILTVVLFLLAVTLAESQTQGFRVTVNYGRTIKEQVKAGKYDWSNPNITSKNFPFSQKGKASILIQLIHFDQDMTSAEVLEELSKQGLRPATLPELLVFGAKFPDKQRDFPIVALGSVWRSDDDRRDVVAYLYHNGSERDLDLRWLERWWSGLCRVAAVRK